MSITLYEALERLDQELVDIPAGTVVGRRYVSGSTPGQPGYYVDVATEKRELVKLVVNRPKLLGLLYGSIMAKGGRTTGGALSARHVRGTRQKAAGGRS